MVHVDGSGWAVRRFARRARRVMVWNVPGWVDTVLGCEFVDVFVASLVFCGCQISECGVASGAVVVLLDPGESFLGEDLEAWPGSDVDEFFL